LDLSHIFHRLLDQSLQQWFLAAVGPPPLLVGWVDSLVGLVDSLVGLVDKLVGWVGMLLVDKVLEQLVDIVRVDQADRELLVHTEEEVVPLFRSI